VAKGAAARGIPTEKWPTLKDPEPQRRLRELRPDVMVVAAYGLLLPPAVLEIPARGCLNIHASLLPRWRGAAPIQRALLAGDPETGISIMQMAADSIPAPSAVVSTPIGARESSGTLLQRLTEIGASAIVDALGRLDACVPSLRTTHGQPTQARCRRWMRASTGASPRPISIARFGLSIPRRAPRPS
jgi:methionyl-tRNA formyltransferase